MLPKHPALVSRKEDVKPEKLVDQPINSYIKQYKEIRKLTTGQNEDYTRGCLLVYDSIKNHYKLIVTDLSRLKQLDAEPKAIQQIYFFGQIKSDDELNANGNHQRKTFNLKNSLVSCY